MPNNGMRLTDVADGTGLGWHARRPGWTRPDALAKGIELRADSSLSLSLSSFSLALTHTHQKPLRKASSCALTASTRMTLGSNSTYSSTLSTVRGTSCPPCLCNHKCIPVSNAGALALHPHQCTRTTPKCAHLAPEICATQKSVQRRFESSVELRERDKDVKTKKRGGGEGETDRQTDRQTDRLEHDSIVAWNGEVEREILQRDTVICQRVDSVRLPAQV